MKLIFALLYLTTIDCCTVHVYLPHTKIPFIQTSAVARNIHVNFYMCRICLFLGDNLNLESENFGICAIFLNSQCVISLNLCHLVSLLLFAWTSCVIPLTTRQIHHVKWFSVNKDMHETYIHHKKKQVKIRHKSQIQLISMFNGSESFFVHKRRDYLFCLCLLSSESYVALRRQVGDCSQGQEERLQASSYLSVAAVLRCKRSDRQEGWEQLSYAWIIF